jgi:hypothetical protein
MFPPLPPPPEPPRVTAVEVRICPGYDPKCYFELANDVLEGVAGALESSVRSYSENSGPVTVTPGTGRLTWTGYVPEAIVGPPSSASASTC